jgi:hypothetical protein
LGPIGHTLASLSVGVGVWSVTGSPLAIPVAFAAGVLPDLDHITDFFDPKENGRSIFMLRPFHAWEIFLVSLLVVLAFQWGDLFWAAVLGYLSHLMMDQMANRVHPLAYCLTFRVLKGFRRRHLTPRFYDPAYLAARESMPLWGRLEPSIWRLVTRLRSQQN